MQNGEWNKDYWDGEYDWSGGGEEWSVAWGGSAAQWFGAILPRIRSFVPCGTILEIAPGYGRWTRFALGNCRQLVAVDLSAECVDACRRIFGDQAEFYVNDGRSLEMIADGSVDFVFSFDSLVHAEPHVLQAYVEQIMRKLTPGGAAFLHHSNLGQHMPRSAETYARNPVMSADVMRSMVDASGGKTIGQEIITWGSAELVDCLTAFSLPGAFATNEVAVWENPQFMNEAALIQANIARWEVRRR